MGRGNCRARGELKAPQLCRESKGRQRWSLVVSGIMPQVVMALKTNGQVRSETQDGWFVRMLGQTGSVFPVFAKEAAS